MANGLIDTAEALRTLIGDSVPLVSAKLQTSLDDMAKSFIARSPLLMLSTANAQGLPDVSPRGDDPGFVWVRDDRTLFIPERPGNRLIYSLQNILESPAVGLLFMIPGVRESYRVHGTARLVSSVDLPDQLAARGKPALLAIEVSVTKAFLHCGKALIRSNAWTSGKDSKPGYTFGAVIAKAAGGDDSLAVQVDDIVKDDYTNNL